MELVTIAEIARALGVPDSTVRYYRDRFETHLPCVGSGRSRRYLPEAVDMLQDIMAAVKGGATIEEVRHSLPSAKSEVAVAAAALMTPPATTRVDEKPASSVSTKAGKSQAKDSKKSKPNPIATKSRSPERSTEKQRSAVKSASSESPEAAAVRPGSADGVQDAAKVGTSEGVEAAAKAEIAERTKVAGVESENPESITSTAKSGTAESPEAAAVTSGKSSSEKDLEQAAVSAKQLEQTARPETTVPSVSKQILPVLPGNLTGSDLQACTAIIESEIKDLHEEISTMREMISNLVQLQSELQIGERDKQLVEALKGLQSMKSAPKKRWFGLRS